LQPNLVVDVVPFSGHDGVETAIGAIWMVEMGLSILIDCEKGRMCIRNRDAIARHESVEESEHGEQLPSPVFLRWTFAPVANRSDWPPKITAGALPMSVAFDADGAAIRRVAIQFAVWNPDDVGFGHLHGLSSCVPPLWI